MVLYLKNISSKNLQAIREKLIFNAGTKGFFWSMSCLVLTNTDQYSDNENGLVLLYEDVTTTKDSWDLAQMNMYQVTIIHFLCSAHTHTHTKLQNSKLFPFPTFPPATLPNPLTRPF